MDSACRECSRAPSSAEKKGSYSLLLSGVGQAPELSKRQVRRALAVALATSAAVLALVAWRSPAGHNRIQLERGGADFMRPMEKVEVAPQCGTVDEDTDYVIESTEGYGVDYIPSADNCCALCWGDSTCKAWVYVKASGDTPSSCWIKGGAPTRKVHRPGVVSGLAPARVAFEDAPPPQISYAGIVMSPSLFCFSLALPSGAEMGLLRWQLDRRVSIFACSETSVYTNRTMQLTPGFSTSLVDSDLHCDIGGYSGTALNSWIFIAVWKAVIGEGKYLRNDWTVKVDPDAVFFPERLQFVLKDSAGAPYVNNCKYGLHGPIEVLSKGVLDALSKDYDASWDKKAPKRCVTEQDFGLYGEDMFLQVCMDKILDVGQAPLDGRLLCEAHCDCETWYWCDGSTDTVTFHPFKTVDAYGACMAAAQLATAKKGSALATWQESAVRVGPQTMRSIAQAQAATSSQTGNAYGTSGQTGSPYTISGQTGNAILGMGVPYNMSDYTGYDASGQTGAAYDASGRTSKHSQAFVLPPKEITG